MNIALARILLWCVISTCSISAVAGKPQRIVSLSLCTDQLLLMLVDKQRIAALSRLAIDPLYSHLWESASGLTTHDNLAEQIVPLNPDLILATPFGNSNTKHMLKRLGHTIYTVQTPENLTDVENITRRLGQVLHEPERAEGVIRSMYDKVSTAQQLIIDKPKHLAISYGPNGYTAGKHTMKNEILELAGYRNLAAELGISYFGNVSLETLILSNPDAVIFDENIPNQHSLAQRSVNHPALQQLLATKQHSGLATPYWICPGPIAGEAVLKLAEQRL